jgi:hypothetical protein
MKPNRDLGIAAAFLLLAGAGGAAFAHPHPDGDGDRDGRTVERVVVIHDGEGDGHDGKGERVQRIEIHRDGKGEHHAGGPRVRRFEMHGDGRLVDCGGGEKIVDESSDEGGRKTKVIICRKGAPTAATAKHLEDALARIRTNDRLSAEQKARIETALRSAIDRARSTR